MARQAHVDSFADAVGAHAADCLSPRYDPLTGLLRPDIIETAFDQAVHQGWKSILIYTDGTAISFLNQTLKQFTQQNGERVYPVENFIAWSIGKYQHELEKVIERWRHRPDIFLGARKENDDSAVWLISGPDFNDQHFSDIQRVLTTVEKEIHDAWNLPGLGGFKNIEHPKDKSSAAVGFPSSAIFVDSRQGDLKHMIATLETRVKSKRDPASQGGLLQPRDLATASLDQQFAAAFSPVLPKKTVLFLMPDSVDIGSEPRSGAGALHSGCDHTVCLDILNLGTLNSALNSPVVDSCVLEPLENLLKQSGHRWKKIGAGRYLVATSAIEDITNITEAAQKIFHAELHAAAAAKTDELLANNSVGLVATYVENGPLNGTDMIDQHAMQKEMFRIFGISHIHLGTKEVIYLNGKPSGAIVADGESTFNALLRSNQVTKEIFETIFEQKIAMQLVMTGVLDIDQAHMLLKVQYMIDKLRATHVTDDESILAVLRDRPKDFLERMTHVDPIVHETTEITARASMTVRPSPMFRLGELAKIFYPKEWKMFGDSSLCLQLILRVRSGIDDIECQRLSIADEHKRNDFLARRPQIGESPGQTPDPLMVMQYFIEGTRLGIFEKNNDLIDDIRRFTAKQMDRIADDFEDKWPLITRLLRTHYSDTANTPDPNLDGIISRIQQRISDASFPQRAALPALVI